MRTTPRRPRAFRPGLDTLEGRVVLSTVAAPRAAGAVTAQVAKVHATRLGSDTYVYSGIAQTTIQVRDRFLNLVATPTFTTRVRVVFGRPVATSGFRESNPFSLILGNPDGTTRYGNFWLQSAGVVTTPSGRRLGLQYLRISASGRSFSGQLVNDYSKLGAAANAVIYPKEVLNYYMAHYGPMARGTRFAGQFSGNRLAITISGNTTDMFHPFVIRIVATTSRAPRF